MLNMRTSNNWRASLVPAAAVIPAPIAYIKVVAVKKLVVSIKSLHCSDTFVVIAFKNFLKIITLRKLECSKQAFA